MSTKIKASSKNKKATSKKVTKKVVANKKAVKVAAKAKPIKKSIAKAKVVAKKAIKKATPKKVLKPVKKVIAKKIVKKAIAKKVAKPVKKVLVKKTVKAAKKAAPKKIITKKIAIKAKPIAVKVEKPVIVKAPIVKAEKPIKEKKVKAPIVKKPIIAPTTFRQTETAAPAKFVKEPAGKFEMEFVIRASEDMVFEFVSTESGLSEWFCDDVNIRDGIFTFNWDGQIQQAKLVKEIPPISIRYQWLDKNDGSYFEFRTQKDELTNDISLIITDFAADKADEVSARLLWHSQVDKLLHVLGSFF